MYNLLRFRATRFIAVAFFVTLASAGWYLIVASIPYVRPTPICDLISQCLAQVASWPFFVYSAQYEPSWFVFILLSIASGLFWALILELFLTARWLFWTRKPMGKIISN